MVRKFIQSDKDAYIKMANEFYHTDAVDKPVPIEHFSDAFDEMMRSDQSAQGYILELDGKTAGFCVTAKTYSVEAGGIVIWVEDFYVLPEFRSRGLGKEFLNYIEKNGDKKLRRLRLEIEDENVRAIELYEKMGFIRAPYNEMWKEIKPFSKP